MIKKGRPKKIDKARNRVHPVILDETAEVIFRKMCSLRGSRKWFNEYVSEHIKKDFNTHPLAIHLYYLRKLEMERDEYEVKIKELGAIISKIKSKKMKVIVDKEMKKVGDREAIVSGQDNYNDSEGS